MLAQHTHSGLCFQRWSPIFLNEKKSNWLFKTSIKHPSDVIVGLFPTTMVCFSILHNTGEFSSVMFWNQGFLTYALTVYKSWDARNALQLHWVSKQSPDSPTAKSLSGLESNCPHWRFFNYTVPFISQPIIFPQRADLCTKHPRKQSLCYITLG